MINDNEIKWDSANEAVYGLWISVAWYEYVEWNVDTMSNSLFLSVFSIKLLAVQDLLEREALDKVKWNDCMCTPPPLFAAWLAVLLVQRGCNYLCAFNKYIKHTLIFWQNCKWDDLLFGIMLAESLSVCLLVNVLLLCKWFLISLCL